MAVSHVFLSDFGAIKLPEPVDDTDPLVKAYHRYLNQMGEKHFGGRNWKRPLPPPVTFTEFKRRRAN